MFNKKNSIFKVKKVYLVIGIVFTAFSFANAQFTVGAKAGVNINQFTMPGTTIGLNAGAFGTYTVTPFLSARLELLYAQQGGGLRDYSLPLSDPRLADYSGNVLSLTYINPYVYMHCIEVPLLAELTLPEFAEASVQPVLFLGGSYAFMYQANQLHTARYTFKDGTFANIPYLREHVRSNFNSNQFSVLGGFGLKFKSETRDFYFDIRYRQGLNQLNQVQRSLTSNDGRLYSSTLSFNFSVSILKF